MRGCVVRNRDAWVRGAPAAGGPSGREGAREPQSLEGASCLRPWSVVPVTARDRGEERRRLLRAVRTDAEADAAAERADAGEHREPAPDGGTVTFDEQSVRCVNCDRTYPTAPGRCHDCGSSGFVASETFASEDVD